MAIREINSLVYRITYVENGSIQLIMCDTENEMIEYVAKLSKRWIVNVSEIDLRTMKSTRVALRSNPYYKELMKK